MRLALASNNPACMPVFVLVLCFGAVKSTSACFCPEVVDDHDWTWPLLPLPPVAVLSIRGDEETAKGY